MSTFVKVSALSEKDRAKVKDYWTDLWGAEFASAVVEDYKSTAKTQKVASK